MSHDRLLHRRKHLKKWAVWRLLKLAATLVIATSFSSVHMKAEDLVDAALKFFLATDSNTAGFDLDKSRPQPVTSEYKSRVLNSLPQEGRITNLKEQQLRKLASLDAILQLHQRQSVYQYVVFKAVPVPYAFIGLNHRVALLISDTALNLLNV
jgi:hypothetical protein